MDPVRNLGLLAIAEMDAKEALVGSVKQKVESQLLSSSNRLQYLVNSKLDHSGALSTVTRTWVICQVRLGLRPYDIIVTELER